MANDTYIFMVRAALAKTVLEKLPRQCPSWRNTNLQIASLERMAGKFYKRFWPVEAASVLGGGIGQQEAAEGHGRRDRQAQQAGEKAGRLA